MINCSGDWITHPVGDLKPSEQNMNWRTWVLFVGLLWISTGKSHPWCQDKTSGKLKKCLTSGNKPFVVPDKFNAVIKTPKQWTSAAKGCIVFLQNGTTGRQTLQSEWPQMETKDAASLLHISKSHIKTNVHLYVLQGKKCNTVVSNLTGSTCEKDLITGFSEKEHCWIACLHTKSICEESTYDHNYCNQMVPLVMNKYIINITATKTGCLNCDNPVKKPEAKLDLAYLNGGFEKGEEVRPAQAAEVMTKMSDLATSINVSSAAVTIGGGVTGILVKETDPADVQEVSFAYGSSNESINIIESRDSLASFARSVTVPKEAFEKSAKMNISAPFAAFLRFPNLAKDEKNSTVLGDEVLAIEMGTMISNLTDTISFTFRNVTYEGTPSCQSWNGEGNQTNWTDSGCLTIKTEDNITCQCSHLTFFAILLAPLNETTSSSDLNTLTIITQVGCGLSMFFLSIVLFMHFLLRRTKASKATRILIHLVSAMFLLNFTFLINNFVAKLKSSVGCKIMAALMHYFMLATFTWFAVQAFHLCLQLYTGGNIAIRHYVLKVSITSWVLPSVVGVVLLIIGKYGEQVILTNDSEENVAMCWITDSSVHYIVNIGYYALVFLFTFVTFIIMLSWLFCLKRSNAANAQIGRSGKSIVTILGLCCMLGITWGFAFFAHGVLRIPAYYIFTVLNSFQGFFLFIYYYNTSHSGEINGVVSGHTNTSSTTTNTLNTDLDTSENPYGNLQDKG
ncbi:adhesion G-protein coupled receptor G5-like [Chelmon rostratus]|uniref:adhesion G-protein coupled receptor G5-like n=1 Tax=Chelmon rostratus TaxID=109905 RepID=UPI001BECF8E1|nr:adhesion G-protein coupled receptor G5-like [Chelmon rostratus]